MATKKNEAAAADAEQAVETTAQVAADTTKEDAAAEAEEIIAQAKAEAAKIVAEAEAQASAAKADDTQTADSAAGGDDELVPIRLFKDNDKYKDDVFVAVNGERVQIKRGETVMVKRKFARVLEQSMDQDAATANLIETESSRYEAEAKARNL